MKTFSTYIAIIFVCTLAGIPMAAFVTWGHLFPTSESLSMLPSLPVDAEKVVGVSGVGFYDMNPWVQTTDEKIHVYMWREAWQTEVKVPSYSMLDGELCQYDTLKLIEASAGDIKDCVTVVPMGEWCSAPLTSIAVTENGEVWQYEKELPCTHFFILMFPIFMVFGFVVGIMIVLYMVFRAFIRRFRVMK